ncbi:MAG: Do family serine endopeptidase [Pseudobacteriovorax sp.]|nr:Do family serine endopeptidase [Pseudobacteriovorax sp.]
MKTPLKLLAVVLSLGLSWSPAMSYELPPSKAIAGKETDLLDKISKGLGDLSEKASSAIVFISVKKTVSGRQMGQIDPFDFFFGPRRGFPQGPSQRQQAGLGSGFIVDLDKGYVLTNNHVIDGADEISLKMANGKTYDAKVIGADSNTDVAVVQIEDKSYSRKGLSQLSLGDSDRVKVGSFVLALGAPFGLETSLSFGVVSAIGRGSLNITSLGDFIQTDAAINPGNSGGPLIDMKGRVIGMNTAIYSRSGASAGIGFAVPSQLVRKIASQLINKGKVARGYLGVQMSPPITEDIAAALNLPKDVKEGALIGRVERGTPAAKANLQDGDVIVEVDSKKITSNERLTTTVGLLPPGKKVKVKFYRNGKLKSTSLTLGEFPTNPRLASSQSQRNNFENTAGLKLENLSSSRHSSFIDRYNIESRKGLLIVDINPDSPGAQAGLRPGDVIIKANRKSVDSPETFEKMFSKSNKLLVQIERSGGYRFASIRK